VIPFNGEPVLIDTIATVERNDLTHSASTRSYGRLRLRLEQNLPVLPGQFAMLKPRAVIEPLLRRAMAFYQCHRNADGLSVEFIYQILGRGTQALSRLERGDQVEFLGALGNTYDKAAAEGGEALLVAGGAGSPALFMLAQELLPMNIPVRLFIGGASRHDLCGLDDFTALLGAGNVITATVDGTHGEKGFVTTPLERYLKENAGRSPMIYSCGPAPMLHRVSLVAADYKVPAQLSLEAPMACGFGICVGCAVAVKAECPEGFVYKKVCTDGPVFWSQDLHW
jgi:dihydroorotate dehydrogenase electron transfer subunit